MIAIILKLTISLFIIILLFRFMGSSYMKENTPLDVANIVILGGFTSIIATGKQYSIIECIIVIAFWCLLIYLMDYLKKKSRIVKNFIQGKPKLVIEDGKMIRNQLEKENITYEELMDMLRSSNVYEVNEVEKAWLEISGKITVKKKGGKYD